MPSTSSPETTSATISASWRSGEYEVVTLALKEDTLEPLIVYRNLKTQTIWARTHQNWSEKVEVNGQKFPRFQKIT